MAVRIHLLGHVLIETADSVIEERDLPGRRGRVALAYLILERDRPIPAESLAELLWPNEPPEDWQPRLETLVSKLQKLLERAELAGRGAITAKRGTYELRLPDLWIDTEVAVRKVEEAKSALERGETEKARRAATLAVDLTDRSFLAGEEGSWIDRQRARFRQVHTDALDVLAEPVERPGARAQGQRVRKTFMFTDIVESTKLIELLGDDAWADLVRWHDLTLRGFFESLGGEEIDRAGDGFFVAFPNQPSALGCAIAIQRRLAEHRRSHGFAPKVRIGLHSAEVHTEEGLYHGKGVNEAARIAAQAEGGQIVASSVTVENLVEARASDVRTVDLKGIARPTEIVTLLWD